MGVNDGRTIEELRAEIAELPAGCSAERSRLSAALGLGLADLHLRYRPGDDDRPRRSLSREALDEIITLFDAAGGERGNEIQIRDALLRCVRFMSFDGSPDDRDRAIAGFRGVLARPGVAVWESELAHLQLGMLLLVKYLPLGLRATTTPDLGTMMKLMGGFTGVGPEAGPDLGEAVEHLQHASSSGVWPPAIAGYAAVLLPLAMLLRPSEDPARVLGLFTEAVQKMPPDAPGRPEVDAMQAWLAIGTMRKEGDPGRVADAIQAVDEQIGRLSEGHALRGPLQFEKGMALLGNGSVDTGLGRIEEILAIFTQALEETPEDHPFRQSVHGAFGGALVTAVAWNPRRGDGPEGERFVDVERAVEHARQVVADQERRAASGVPEERMTLGRDRFMLGMALFLRGLKSGRDEDVRAGREELDGAMLLLDQDDELAPALMGVYGGLLSDLHLAHGSLQHAMLAEGFLGRAVEVLESRARGDAPASHDLATMRAIAGISRIIGGWRRRDAEGIAGSAAALHDALDGISSDHAFRPQLLAALALGHMTHGQLTRDITEICVGLGYVRQAADALQPQETSQHQAIRAMAAVASLAHGVIDGDGGAIRRAVPRLERLLRGTTFGPAQRANLLAGLAMAMVVRYEQGEGVSADLDAAVRRLDEAAALLKDGPGDRLTTEVFSRQADAYRLLGRHDAATDAGLAALRARVHEVLLQTSPEHGLLVAREGADRAQEVARWCLADGRPERAVTALELGRGLVLHSATVTAGVPELLAAEGDDETAERWREAVAVGGEASFSAGESAEQAAVTAFIDGFVGGETSADLRRRVLKVLRRSDRHERLLDAPGLGEIGGALSHAGTHALVYLLPGAERGWAIIVDAAGRPDAVPLPGLGAERSAPLREYTAALNRLTALRVRGPAPRASAGDRQTPGPGVATGTPEQDDDGPARAGEAYRRAVTEAQTAWERTLGELCDWAWPAVMDDVHRACARRAPGTTTPRIVLVPCGVLGVVTWHAARRTGKDGRFRYACEDMVLSYAATGRQFVDSVERGRRRQGRGWGAPMLVARPLGRAGHSDQGLLGAAFEVEALRQAFYPDATIVGRAFGRECAAGTPAEVLAALGADTPPALFHCATHAVTGDPPLDSELWLASGADDDGVLTLGRILAEAQAGQDAMPCELVVLSTCLSDLTSDAHDEALTIATSFAAAGATNVVGSRWAVPDGPAAALMFMIHHYLVAERQTVADALRAAHRWMLDPARQAPATMPTAIRVMMDGDRPLDDPYVWAAFTHQGGGTVSFTAA